ncbi:ABC transporter substrate-binding protein [Sphaerimonospora mesophila]|uniref:ABC transporter substrate-binding protein n=1 Tax=Sphaerimonospora mesophila TaxID=37483 RepID=UPI0006E1C80E
MAPLKDSAASNASRFSRRSFFQLQLGAGALLLVGCARGTSTDGAGAQSGGGSTDTLRIAVPSDPGSLDQDYLAFDLVGLALMKNYYPYLIDHPYVRQGDAMVQDTTKALPVIAESWTSDDTGRVWTLKLKQGVTFPSGNELTADDVKWSRDRAFEAKANVAGIYRMIGLTEPGQVEVVDRYTVRFDQSKPSALSSAIQVIALYICDSVEMKKHATADDPWAKAWSAKNATGGGVYNIASYQRGGQMILQLNDKYPLDVYGTGVTPFPKVEVRIVPSPANRRLQLEKGDIDIAFGLGQRDIADLESKSGIKVISAPGTEFYHIPLSVTTAPFDDRKVRQALAYAMPYEQILTTVFQGKARRSTSPLPLDMPGHSEKGYPYDTDLEKAKALLAEAGKQDGFTTTLAIDADNQIQEQMAVIVKNQLAKIGITLEISKLDPAQFAERRAKNDIPMQIAVGQLWVNDAEYLMATSLTKDSFLNYADYRDPRVEKIFERVTVAVDQGEREKAFAELQDILAEDVPWLMLCQPDFQLPVRSHVTGWAQPVDGLFRLGFLGK